MCKCLRKMGKAQGGVLLKSICCVLCLETEVLVPGQTVMCAHGGSHTLLPASQPASCFLKAQLRGNI